jgi:hypothetical protein
LFLLHHPARTHSPLYSLITAHACPHLLYSTTTEDTVLRRSFSILSRLVYSLTHLLSLFAIYSFSFLIVIFVLRPACFIKFRSLFSIHRLTFNNNKTNQSITTLHSSLHIGVHALIIALLFP